MDLGDILGCTALGLTFLLPGCIAGSVIGLAVASRGRLGYKMRIADPPTRTNKLLIGSAVSTMAFIPTTFAVGRAMEDAIYRGDSNNKVIMYKNVHKALILGTALSYSTGGCAIGYSLAWRTAQRMKWTR